MISLFAVAPAFAAEGRREIFEPVVLDGSQEDINGNYFLSRNVTATSAPAIWVLGTGTERVEIDLNGFTVESPPTSRLAIFVDNVKTIVLRNGSVVSQLPGVDCGPGHTVILIRAPSKPADQTVILEDLKATIHPLQRDYDPYSKSWMINEDALTSLIPLIQHYGASDHMLERCRSLLRDAEEGAAQHRIGRG